MTGRVEGKSVVVFGAGSAGPGCGNGKAAAVLFAREGAGVFCVDRNGPAAAETAGIIAAEGLEGAAFEADVTDPHAVAHAVAEAKRRSGSIDIVHFSRPNGIIDGTPEDVAEAAVFLASDAAGYITGAELVVDGGLTLTVPAA